LHQVAVEDEEAMSLDEQREKRKKNIVLYRVPEIQSHDTNNRKAGDMLFLHGMCNDVLGVTVSSGDVEGMYRHGEGMTK